MRRNSLPYQGWEYDPVYHVHHVHVCNNVLNVADEAELWPIAGHGKIGLCSDMGTPAIK